MSPPDRVVSGAGLGLKGVRCERAPPPAVPSGPPRSISVTNITNTSAILKWEEPAIPNGVVTMYQVTVITSLKENTTSTSGTVSDLQGLPPHTQVTVTVAAVTSEGVGPVGSTVFRTMEGGW